MYNKGEEIMSDAKDKIKETIKVAAKGAIKKALSAVANAIRTKLLPKLQARCCKAMQDASLALVDRADEAIESLEKETDKKKIIRKTYTLKLIQNTAEAVGSLLLTTAKHIEDNVDFSTIEVDTTEVEEAIAEAEEDDDEYNELVASVDVPHCDEDGCEIA
jgi:hypothetical protein